MKTKKNGKTAKVLLTDDELNPNQEKFCQLFVSKDYLGNGVQAYLEVYNIDKKKKNWYKTACVAASQLLSNIKVCDRINKLLENIGLNDQHVDKQLAYLVSQFSDNTNKLGAIREYNKMKKRTDVISQDINLKFEVVKYSKNENSV